MSLFNNLFELGMMNDMGKKTKGRGQSNLLPLITAEVLYTLDKKKPQRLSIQQKLKKQKKSSKTKGKK